jgi:hypothetical protein
MQAFAVTQIAAAFLFYIGSRTATFVLIICTLLQAMILHNPVYKRHTTEVDRARAARQCFTDLCLCASLMVLAGSRKF